MHTFIMVELYKTAGDKCVCTQRHRIIICNEMVKTPSVGSTLEKKAFIFKEHMRKKEEIKSHNDLLGDECEMAEETKLNESWIPRCLGE